jgi:hypothetical protein
MAYKFVLLKCKTDGETFELDEHQNVVFPLQIASCPHCKEPHSYQSDEISEVIIRNFEADEVRCELCGHVHIGVKQCRVEVSLESDPTKFKLCECPNPK